MAALTSNDLNVVPIIDPVAKTIRIKDLVDYTTYGITPASGNPAGCYTATQVQTSDQFYNNTNFASPDINVFVSNISTPAVNFPLDSVSGLMLTGNFTVNYRLRYLIEGVVISQIFGGITQTISFSKDLFGDYRPYVGMTIVTSGNTNPENNGTFVITEVETPDDGPNYFLKVAGGLVNESGGPSKLITFYFEYARSFTFCLKDFVMPEVKICTEWSCLNGTFTSKDITALGNPSSDSLVHTVKYPQSLGDQQPPDVVANTTTVNVGPPIWTMTWTSIVTHTLEYTYDDGLIMSVVISGSKDTDVSCFDLCCLLEGLKKMYDKFAAEINASGQSQYKNAYLQALGLFFMIREFSERCNNSKEAEKLVDQLKDVLALYKCGCDDCCGGETETPQEITPSSTSIIGAQFVSLIPIPGLDATNVQQAIFQLFNLITQNVFPSAANYADYVFWDGSAWVASPSIGIDVPMTNGSSTHEYPILNLHLKPVNTCILFKTYLKGDTISSILSLKMKYTDIDGNPGEHVLGSIPCGERSAQIEVYTVFNLVAQSVNYIQINGVYSDGEVIYINGGFVSDIRADSDMTIETSWPTDSGFTSGTRFERTVNSI